jgi:dTDP-4-amino-4,6-dideoxygalactose transaminase
MNSPLKTGFELSAGEIFSRLPPNRVGELDRRYLNEVLDAGFRNTEDPANIFARLESAFAERFGVSYAILHNSGTGTMQSCLLAAGIGPGDEVIVPPLTALATAIVVVQCGAVPVFADIDADTFNIDPADVARRITPHTRAIIPVSLYGLPPDYDGIMELARRHGLTVIEDNAECFLAEYKGRLVGTIGHAASFSFQGSKHMTTGGDGGVVITDDEEYARNIRKRATLGYRTLGAKPGDVFVPRDVRQDHAFERHDIMGYNFRMSAVQAALGLGQLERLEALVAARVYIARQYEQVIRQEDCDWLIPPVTPEGRTHKGYYCHPSLLRVENDEILLAYNYSTHPSTPYFAKAFYRRSSDEGQNWTEQLLVTPYPGYTLVHNDKLFSLRDGRIIAMAEQKEYMPSTQDHSGYVGMCFYSDDNGHSWKVEVQEPDGVELEDGRLMMFARTYSGFPVRAYSNDRGETWSEGEPIEELKMPCAGLPTVRRIPSTGDLLFIWISERSDLEEGGTKVARRCALTTAVSKDEGKSFLHQRNIARDPTNDYGYQCIEFIGDDLALVAYHANDGLHMARIGVDWFYGK